MAIDRQLFTNNAISLLDGPIAASDTTLQVMVGHGDLFPQPAAPGEFFLVTLENQRGTVREIIRVNSRSGDVFNDIERGYEGFPALDWASEPRNDTVVDHRLTAATLQRATGGPSLAFNQPFTLVSDVAETIIQLEREYAPGSTSLYLGGMRQKLGVDYTEVGPTQLSLPYVFTQEMIDEGQSITIDFATS